MWNATRDANNTATLLGISSVDWITPIPIQVDPITGAIMGKLIGSSASPLTTKWDLYTYSAVNARLAIWTNGQVLSADNAQATWLKWITISAWTGDVVWPASSVDSEIALYSGTTGKLLKRGTVWASLTLAGATWVTLTNPVLQTVNSVNNFSQLAIQNKSTGTSSSADIIAYPDNNANDTTGFVNIGVTSSTYADASYAITTANDAYFFGSCVSWSGKLGNLVIATDSTGSLNNIVFGIGGYTSLNKERMRITNTGITVWYSAIASGTIALYNSANAFTGTIQNGTLTASRVYSLPDKTGTFAMTSDITGVNSWTNTGDVTLAGTSAYITISGQVITRSLIDLTTHVTWTLPVWNGGTWVTTSTGSWSSVLSTSPTLVTPLLGTPTSWVLTNCTGLPLWGLTGLATGMATFLGAPSSANLIATVTDETGTWALVFAISPSFTTPTIGGVAIPSISSTNTFTNKTMIDPTNVISQNTTTTSSATPTPTGWSLRNYFTVTAQAVGATFAAPSWTPVDGNMILLRIKDNATAQTLAWNAIYRWGDTALPTTTIISKTMFILLTYNSADSKWDLLSVENNH